MQIEQLSTERKLGQDRNKELRDSLQLNENEYTAYIPSLMGHKENSTTKKVHSTKWICLRKDEKVSF